MFGKVDHSHFSREYEKHFGDSPRLTSRSSVRWLAQTKATLSSCATSAQICCEILRQASLSQPRAREFNIIFPAHLFSAYRSLIDFQRTITCSWGGILRATDRASGHLS